MKAEAVQKVIRQISSGNEDVKTLLLMVGQVGKDQIAQMPDGTEAEKALASRMVAATQRLVHTRIDLRSLTVQGKNYWTTDDGKMVGSRVSQYLDTLARKAR